MFPSAWSHFDILCLGVLLVGFLGFGGTLFYESQRWGRWYNSQGVLNELGRITTNIANAKALSQHDPMLGTPARRHGWWGAEGRGFEL